VLLSEQVEEEDIEGLRDFLTRRKVTAVVVEEAGPGPWPFLLGRCDSSTSGLTPGAQYCTGIGQRKVHHLAGR
jgi:hypothetical protein